MANSSRVLLILAVVGSLSGLARSSCCEGMTMSSAGMSLTESYEGLVQHVYNDVAGNPTVCYGHLVKPGEHFGSFVDLTECKALLKADMGSAENCVREHTNVPLNNNQFDALVDFTYNAGCGAFQSSTLLRDLNSGNYGAVPSQLLRWDHAGGRVCAGLLRRRQAEGRLWGGSSSGGGSSPPPPPPAENPVGLTCSGGSGKCINTDVTSCSGTLDHGLCGGGDNVLCCIDNVPQSCAGDTGTCVNTDRTTCTGSILYDRCPGASNILCCVPSEGTSCDNGGSCINVDTTTCSGPTRYGLCPGANNIRCCPPSDEYYADYAEATNSKNDDTHSGLSEGAQAGIAFACVSIALMAIGVVYVVKTRRTQEANDLQADLLQSEEEL